jgi:hypothetical protein
LRPWIRQFSFFTERQNQSPGAKFDAKEDEAIDCMDLITASGLYEVQKAVHGGQGPTCSPNLLRQLVHV